MRGLIFVMALVIAAGSFDAAARPIVVGFADHSAPYVLPDSDHPGISVEIVREAFRAVGLDVRPIYQSYQRIKEEVRQGRLDAAAGAMPEGQESLHYSAPCIAFDNVAIVKKRDNIAIRSIADLPGHSLVAWQNAHDHLGGEFQRLFGKHVRDDYINKYFNLADQTAQVKMFWSGRADIIIIDDVIFDYMSSRLADSFDTSLELERHRIFGGLTVFSVAFNDAELRDQFDRGLSQLQQRGDIERIYQKYRQAM
ncbi:MAG: amino acid ABC transporter substrate-binding protein [Rhizobiales bacterium]|nr:amino acid ABC transporter substrate-binding protein [Hyphomicrobiales bacterium]